MPTNRETNAYVESEEFIISQIPHEKHVYCISPIDMVFHCIEMQLNRMEKTRII